MDTRRRGALDFGYKVAPVLGIAPNGRHVGAVRDRAEQNTRGRRVDLGIITDTQFCNSRKKIKCFHNSVV